MKPVCGLVLLIPLRSKGEIVWPAHSTLVTSMRGHRYSELDELLRTMAPNETDAFGPGPGLSDGLSDGAGLGSDDAVLDALVADLLSRPDLGPELAPDEGGIPEELVAAAAAAEQEAEQEAEQHGGLRVGPLEGGGAAADEELERYLDTQETARRRTSEAGPPLDAIEVPREIEEALQHELGGEAEAAANPVPMSTEADGIAQAWGVELPQDAEAEVARYAEAAGADWLEDLGDPAADLDIGPALGSEQVSELSGLGTGLGTELDHELDSVLAGYGMAGWGIEAEPTKLPPAIEARAVEDSAELAADEMDEMDEALRSLAGQPGPVGAYPAESSALDHAQLDQLVDDLGGDP